MDTSKPIIFSDIESYLNLIPQPFSDPEKQKEWENFGKSISDIRKEYELMKDLTSKCGTLACGFTHNDLLLPNIIYDKEKGKVSFIDYEYGGYNFLIFDVGNHFVEHAGVEELDHSLYPNRAYIKEWLKVYFTEYNSLRGDNSAISDAVLERACDLANFFGLWANMWWGLWGLVQAEHSAVEFNYIGYAKSKLGQYFIRKKEFTAFLRISSEL